MKGKALSIACTRKKQPLFYVSYFISFVYVCNRINLLHAFFLRFRSLTFDLNQTHFHPRLSIIMSLSSILFHLFSVFHLGVFFSCCSLFSAIISDDVRSLWDIIEFLPDCGLPCACTHEALISGGRKRAYTSWFNLAVVLGTTGSRRSVSISPVRYNPRHWTNWVQLLDL